VPDEVIIPKVELLHNELCVKQHKATEQQQTKVELKLVCVCVVCVSVCMCVYEYVCGVCVWCVCVWCMGGDCVCEKTVKEIMYTC